jgi:DNA-binding NtrC family response regulator
MSRVLIVDDDPEALRHTAAVVASLGYDVVTATSGAAALSVMRADSLLAAVVLDLVMPDCDGMAVLETMVRDRLSTPAIVAIANPSPETVATVLNAGALDFLDKPATPARLLAALAHARHRATAEAAPHGRSPHAHARERAPITSRSPAMERPLAVCRKAARSPLPLLIEGESGSGRKHLARAVHAMGDRAGRPFVVLDCAATPTDRLEAALFGTAGHPGKLAEAHAGTLLLDEIGELSHAAQLALLEVIEPEARPLRPSRGTRHNVRLIATSRRRLLNLARSGAFDARLYNRLNVLPLYLPPLRDRPEDLAPLATQMLAGIAAETGARIAGVAPEAMALLARYDWPGNLRELENCLYRAVSLASATTLESADFPHLLAALHGRAAAVTALQHLAPPSAPVHVDRAIAPLKQMEGSPDRFLTPSGELTSLAALERELIIFALETHRGRMSAIARALGIGRSTLYRKLRDYGLDDRLVAEPREAA